MVFQKYQNLSRLDCPLDFIEVVSGNQLARHAQMHAVLGF